VTSRSLDALAAVLTFGAAGCGSSSKVPATRSAWNEHSAHAQIQPVRGLIAAPHRGHSGSNTEWAGWGATGSGTTDSVVTSRSYPGSRPANHDGPRSLGEPP
jgi:hypothetical protein